MRIEIRGKNIKLTEGLRQHVTEKIGHLEHYLDQILDAHVTLRVERDVQIVDVILNLPHHLMKAEERSPDMYASIDMVRDRLEHQIFKYKTRRAARRHLTGPAARSAAAAAIEPTKPERDNGARRGPVARIKRFPVKPMELEDAAYQMELLGHDFFVFINSETDAVNVLYKRKSGDLGLLEPLL